MGYSPWGPKEVDTTERLRTRALLPASTLNVPGLV